MVVPSNCQGKSSKDKDGKWNKLSEEAQRVERLKDQYGVANVVFDDDPALLFEYLKDRYLTIDLFDGENMFYFGSCKVPLVEFVRQQRESVTLPRVCEIQDHQKTLTRGHLCLVMTHKGIEVQKSPIEDAKYLEEFNKRSQPSQKGQTMRRKIVS